MDVGAGSPQQTRPAPRGGRGQSSLASRAGMSNCNTMVNVRIAKYRVGQIVRHRFFPFRGVVFDVDPVFANTDEWYRAIPEEIRPSKDQPFYHLLAENAETEYIAYVSEQNLLPDDTGQPVSHPQVR